MKKVLIIVGIVLVLIIGSIMTYGYILNKPYKKAEKLLVKNAEKYMGEHVEMFPEKGIEFRITNSELITYGYGEELKVKDEVCDGYVSITNETMGYKYKAYIQCQEYKTK